MKMDGLITEIKTLSYDRQPSLLNAAEKKKTFSLARSDLGTVDTDPTSPDRILSILKSRPSQDEIAGVLAVLDPSRKEASPTLFDIRVPSPTTAQILNALVSITVPDHWDALTAGSKKSKPGNPKLRGALLRCFSSIPGISCLVTQLRSLIHLSRSASQQAKGSGCQIQIKEILALMSALLEPRDLSFRLYTEIQILYNNQAQKQAAWKEYITLIGASKILSLSAEAITLVPEIDTSSAISWIGDGPRYVSWLGSSICFMASKSEARGEEQRWRAIATLTGRAMSLGYTDQLVREVYSGLLLDQNLPRQYFSLLNHLRRAEQLTIVEAIFRDVEKKYFSQESSERTPASLDQKVDSVAALCSTIIPNNSNLESQLVDWLSKGQGGSIRSIGLLRALIANLAQKDGLVMTLLTRSLRQSADKIYIQHAPIRSQEVNTQVTLLAAGYLQRLEPASMRSIGRTSTFLNAVSNRLAAASTRARFLGMIIGTAISRLIEEPGKAMRFDLEEMESKEAKWYLNLVNVEDNIGSLDYLKSSEGGMKAQKGHSSIKAHPPQATRSAARIAVIEEIDLSDDGNAEDEDLIPYAKPDEDPSDSDDDPTLIQRNKPAVPVYIHDLIAYLRDTENLDRYELGISTAPSLIRRKTGFGTELSENTNELALLLIGLQEQSKFPRFHEYRLQSIIALIVSQPLNMGCWFSAIFFDGDLSQVQRSAVLTALGLSVRELAGSSHEDANMLRLPELPDSSFPSKRLPLNLEPLYHSNTSPIAALTKQLSQASLQPLAADAANTATGPNALKIRTFSSRMEVERKRQHREAQRQKSTVKDLYKVLSEGFFYPLTRRFEIMIAQFSSSTAPSHNPFFVPHLLCLFIQTLTLVLSTMGPHTPFLDSLTHETLTFLLSLHARPASNEPTIVAALLSLFLAIIDLNVESGTSGEERLVTQFATQVMELREWAGEIFERTPAVQDTADPRDQIRTLSAGVMVKLGEVIERYQGRLMGVNSGFRY